MSTAVVSEPSGFSLPQSQLNVIKWNIYFGFAVLAIGVIMGLDQALNYARVNIFQYYPGLKSYYQGLTIHGVFNALVLTTAFANGFLALTTARGFGRKLNDALLHGAFWTLLVGSLLAVYAMFSRQASVLYTFYPPLQAHWTFYLGLALVVISTWITSAAQLVALRAWRKEHPGERVPLLAFMSIATYVMWDIASVGIAIEVVVFLLPWSLGLFPGVDPMLPSWGRNRGRRGLPPLIASSAQIPGFRNGLDPAPGIESTTCGNISAGYLGGRKLGARCLRIHGEGRVSEPNQKSDCEQLS